MKKEYMKPAMQVVELNMNVQMLAGSLTSITTTGFSESELEDLILSEETRQSLGSGPVSRRY